jgi:hypothetical protein
VRQINRLTLSYDPREDRLRLSAIDSDEQPLVLWLTQRLGNLLVPMLVKSLESDIELPADAPAAARPVAQVLAQTQAELSIRKSPAVAPDPGTSERGLLLGVRVRRNRKTFLLELNWAEGDIALPASGDWLRQFLRIIYNNYRVARWQTQMIFPVWFNTDQQRKLIGENAYN